MVDARHAHPSSGGRCPTSDRPVRPHSTGLATPWHSLALKLGHRQPGQRLACNSEHLHPTKITSQSRLHRQCLARLHRPTTSLTPLHNPGKACSAVATLSSRTPSTVRRTQAPPPAFLPPSYFHTQAPPCRPYFLPPFFFCGGKFGLAGCALAAEGAGALLRSRSSSTLPAPCET